MSWMMELLTYELEVRVILLGACLWAFLDWSLGAAARDWQTRRRERRDLQRFRAACRRLGIRPGL